MSPIRKFFSDESKHTALLTAFWAIIFISIVISSGALKIAYHAVATSDRAEHGFCIAIKLIEGGAVADAAIAANPKTTLETKAIREGTARGGLSYASELRSVVHCDGPPPIVTALYKQFHINPKTSEDK